MATTRPETGTVDACQRAARVPASAGPLPVPDRLRRARQASPAEERSALTASSKRGPAQPRRPPPLHYASGEWATPLTNPKLLGLCSDGIEQLSDDPGGRALDHLFDPNLASPLAETMFAAIANFEIDESDSPDDSTTVSFTGNSYDETSRAGQGTQSVLVVTCGDDKDLLADL